MHLRVVPQSLETLAVLHWEGLARVDRVIDVDHADELAVLLGDVHALLVHRVDDGAHPVDNVGEHDLAVRGEQ